MRRRWYSEQTDAQVQAQPQRLNTKLQLQLEAALLWFIL